jgi:hypothetical protein
MNRGTPDVPALFVTTQKILPQVLALVSAVSLALLALTAKMNADAASGGKGAVPLGTEALILFGIAIFFFQSALKSCVTSHAWDYWSIPEGHRRDDGIPDDEAYRRKCAMRMRLFHRVAVWMYRLGLVSLVLGGAALVWHASHAASYVLLAYLAANFLVDVFHRIAPDSAENVVKVAARRFAKEP